MVKGERKFTWVLPENLLLIYLSPDKNLLRKVLILFY